MPVHECRVSRHLYVLNVIYMSNENNSPALMLIIELSRRVNCTTNPRGRQKFPAPYVGFLESIKFMYSPGVSTFSSNCSTFSWAKRSELVSRRWSGWSRRWLRNGTQAAGKTYWGY